MKAPFTEIVELEGGGTLTFTRFDRERVIRAAYEKGDVRFSYGLSIQDLRQLNISTVALSLATELKP
jgi:hypothetical protein